jgi:hypothetical protein
MSLIFHLGSNCHQRVIVEFFKKQTVKQIIFAPKIVITEFQTKGRLLMNQEVSLFKNNLGQNLDPLYYFQARIKMLNPVSKYRKIYF